MLILGKLERDHRVTLDARFEVTYARVVVFVIGGPDRD